MEEMREASAVPDETGSYLCTIKFGCEIRSNFLSVHPTIYTFERFFIEP
jgi:hypothetical protein